MIDLLSYLNMIKTLSVHPAEWSNTLKKKS